MKINHELLGRIVADLGLDRPFVKGQTINVRNCWHFCTDGNAVDALFTDESDFIGGMNRIFTTVRGYRVVILAFSLMDTHVHFILHGEFTECNRFLHDYIRRTSWDISTRRGESHKLKNLPINHQEVDTDTYLKTVICYTLKNAPVGGLPYMALDYPWSSGPLYFRRPGTWNSPPWLSREKDCDLLSGRTIHDRQSVLGTRNLPDGDIRMEGSLVFPGEYVAYEIVEKLFKTCRSFNYFFCKTREDEVDSRGGSLSLLSIPMQEMRQHKNSVCRELFGASTVSSLDTRQRIQLARTLKSRYNSSLKQIVRLCGLVYDEVKNLF